MCYASEIWTVPIYVKMVFQQETLRKICGPVQENAQWRLHYNKNVYGLCKDIDAVTHIKIIRP
jgi:hypothetical protein